MKFIQKVFTDNKIGVKNLEKILNPESIALVGVSEREGSIGYRLFKNLINGGFRGKIYGVNPNVTQLFEQRIYKSVREIEQRIDLAVIAVPIEMVPSIIRECTEKEIMGAIVISAGEKEAEKEIIREAGRIGMRIIGPNSLGVVIPHLEINASFTASPIPPQGSMAFISQSGALCTAIMDWAYKEKVGFSHVVSMGDMADVDFGDVIGAHGAPSLVPPRPPGTGTKVETTSADVADSAGRHRTGPVRS